MFLAIDDTDSPKNMCTTFVLTEIIHETGMDIIGMPRLVRLNPTIPFKTRGNASLAVQLGKGIGEKRKIGNILGKDIFSYDSGEESIDESDLMDIAEEVIYRYADLDYEGTNPGIVASKTTFDPAFYWKAVREVSEISEAEDFIIHSGGHFRKIKNGRGIIGAAAAIAWPRNAITYELLFYSDDKNHQIPRNLQFYLSEKAEMIQGTFNNIDRENRHPAIFPDQSTPVLMGIRSMTDEGFLENVLELDGISDLHYSRFMLYETNQATDDHIIENSTYFWDFHSYRIDGIISITPYSINGSHYFSEMISNGKRVKIAAFEPTKEFRKIFRQLRPMDLVSVYGSMKNGTLNVEKMQIKATSKIYGRTAPECPDCSVRTVNKGLNDYRCPVCGKIMNLPSYESIERDVSPGFYDVPVSTRRHLSKPFSISGYSLRKGDAS
ncbi:MAG: tRNA(Ile)(2)-agmatinylcytidine synthase [Thermoplasmatales archaeon]|nr:tRNA(Ile)(2)-agmatinylcytidine synthase [Thermoplasmatales archaeon]MCW6169868.1 tRNA(Ile)(2)-agmatinylcytidine synthase [Thermoplasmatales archaeon]